MKALSIVLIAIMAGSMGCAASTAKVKTPSANMTTSPLVVVTGADSKVLKKQYLRISSAEAWKKSWLDHTGHKEDTIYRPAMEVDFDRCTVVAIFGGEYIKSCGYRIESVGEENSTIVVRFEHISFQTFGADGGGDHVTPYAFVVLPKSEKTIVLEQNEQRYIGHSPQWKEVVRLKGE